MMQSSSVSITEIYEAIRRLGDKISRKTIERDMGELIENGTVLQSEGVPIKFIVKPSAEIELALRVDELKLIIDLLADNSDLKRKLVKFCGTV